MWMLGLRRKKCITTIDNRTDNHNGSFTVFHPRDNGLLHMSVSFRSLYDRVHHEVDHGALWELANGALLHSHVLLALHHVLDLLKGM